MDWQELLIDVVPLVISFVSAIVLFFRTGQKKYIARFTEAMRQCLIPNESTAVESDVVVSSDTETISFKPSDYGMTADEVVSAFRSFLESSKNGNDK